MAFNPGVSFFISFNEFDPSKQKRCIFFTQRRTRCRLPCRDRDNQRAVVLHRSFEKMAIDTLSIEMLREYAQCNCCGDARHQDRIEDLELLTPLAQRWLEEIRTRAINRPDYGRTFLCVDSILNTPDPALHTIPQFGGREESRAYGLKNKMKSFR